LTIDTVRWTKSYPRLSVLARRMRALATGRPYFFNRQKIRSRVFREINARIAFDNYIETGTYQGMTTRFLSETARLRGTQVYSCEINAEYFEIARHTAGSMANVHLFHGDSVEFLKSLTPRLSNAVNFVYLDAHWYDHLPLRDELSVLADWRNTVIMIDDFKVPSDSGFGWDRYDDEREICLPYIQGCIGARRPYFPAYSSEAEGSGMARGYCVMASSERHIRVLDRIPLLKKLEAQRDGAL
jgi:predicted O-methyltransferase YrrM